MVCFLGHDIGSSHPCACLVFHPYKVFSRQARRPGILAEVKSENSSLYAPECGGGNQCVTTTLPGKAAWIFAEPNDRPREARFRLETSAEGLGRCGRYSPGRDLGS